jgi:DNA repair protein RadC
MPADIGAKIHEIIDEIIANDPDTIIAPSKKKSLNTSVTKEKKRKKEKIVENFKIKDKSRILVQEDLRNSTIIRPDIDDNLMPKARIMSDDTINPDTIINDEIEKIDHITQKITQKSMKSSQIVEDNQNYGHRQRLWARFKKAPPRNLPDYEILEMMLFYAIPRRDTKKLAKDLLAHFKSLAGVFFADPTELQAVKGIGSNTGNLIALLSDLFSRLCLPTEHKNLHILSNWLSVLNYCQLTMGYKKKETFRVLFLNKKNLLIADELFDTGTIDKVAVYPREIAKQAIMHGAAAVILVHNHPSGDPTPSKEDIAITRKIAEALMAVNVQLHDHLVVAQQQHFSFRGQNLL